MHEKTLLYGALGCTALAAVFAVAHGSTRRKPSTGEIGIAPMTQIMAVTQIDTKTLASTEVPIRLTSSDGTGLRLRSLRAAAVIEDPLALTEMHLTFENPEPRVLEGTFRITLPQGASLSRFAMKVNGAWQEGEVVEKQAARRAYEDFLHRKQDPALLEQGAGNEVSARVFPIPANGVKEILIAYSEVIEAGAPYVLPLRGLPQLGTLDVDVHAAGSLAALGGRSSLDFSLHQQGITPGQDFLVEARRLPRSAGLRSGDLAIARVVPFAISRPEPVTSAIVLVDTSASRGLGLPAQARMVKSVLSKMAPTAAVTVACFDQEVLQVYEGKAGGFGEQEVSAIIARGALGASDFERALVWAGEQAKRTKTKRVVLVGDGVATAGETDAQKLRDKVERLRDAGVDRMDAIAVGGIRDDAFLRTVIRGVLVRDGVVLDAKLGADALARRLGEATSSGVPVTVEGASWSWPRTLDGLQAGDEVIVYAKVEPGKTVKVSVGTQQFAPDLRTSNRPLVERAWAQARIQSLVEAPTEDAATTKREIVALSTQYRVLSPHTAMLALETEDDYRRFSIDRKATVDVLTVHDGQIQVDHEPRSLEQKRARASQEEMPDGKGAARLPSAELRGGMDDPDPHVARAAALQAASEFGMVGMLGGDGDGTGTSSESGPGSGDLSGPTTGGNDHGNMWGDAIGDAFGAGGLGLSGAGEGGGGRGEGSGLGNIGTVGHGVGRAAAPTGHVGPSPIDQKAKAPKASPYEGRLAIVMDRLAQGDRDGALDEAKRWQTEQPGDILALVALGEAYEARGDLKAAARAYGSILELFSFRADSRRFAGERLERLGDLRSLELAADTYGKAAEQRPDHPAGHRLYAFTLLKAGQHEKAFEAMKKGATRTYPSGRFAGAGRILKEDLGLIAAVWAGAQPDKRDDIMTRLRTAGGTAETGPSLRFVLVWETDANDVDFHIRDGRGGHAFYSSPALPSGGNLYADVTTGYGPECFTIRGAPEKRAYPYTLQAHYYSRGPMGYGMGKLEIVEHDGHGNISFDERPFVVMVDRAYVELGSIERPKPTVLAGR